MESSQSSSRPSRPTRSTQVASQTTRRAPGRPSTPSSSDENDEYAALYASRRRRHSPSTIQSPPVAIIFGSSNSRTHRPNFKQNLLSAYRRGVISLFEQQLYEASRVPAIPHELPTTDEMILEALDAPNIRILTFIFKRDPSYKWSDLAVLKAIKKDKAFDPPLYLDSFLYLGLSPHTVWDPEEQHHDALMWAVKTGSPDFVAPLLSAGANPNGAKVGETDSWANAARVVAHANKALRKQFRKVFSRIAVAAGLRHLGRPPRFSIV
jgi:hypothetical protein